MTATFTCRVVDHTLVSPPDESPFWLYALSVSNQGNARLLRCVHINSSMSTSALFSRRRFYSYRTDDDFWQWHNSIKLFREYGVSVPSHPREPRLFALTETDMPARRAELDAYMASVLALTAAPTTEHLQWKKFVRARNSFFEADTLCAHARAGRLAELRASIEGDSAIEIDARDTTCSTALHFAAAFGHADVVRYLCDAGASVQVCPQ